VRTFGSLMFPGMTEDEIRDRWFLTKGERGNPATHIDAGRPDDIAWTTGNRVEVLVDGASYYRRLLEELARAGKGDWIYFTDWRGDPDERLAGEGTEIVRLLSDAARRGAHVHGLIWRSHPQATRFSEEANFYLAQEVDALGGEVLLDERVRRGGSHHQKLFLIRHPSSESEDVAFVGGIDLCHGRNDDGRHRGDPQVYRLDERYGPRPAWHDVQIEVRGPAITDLDVTFRERWEDTTPLDHRNPWRRLLARRGHEPEEPGSLPPPASSREPMGPHAVQVLRTYPAKRPPYPFAPGGERSIARAYHKAYARARKLIYLEDQYFWSSEIAELIAEQLKRSPELHIIVLLPRFFEQEGWLSSSGPRRGRSTAIEVLEEATPDRVAFYDIENEEGLPIYVHAKVCIIDDVWAEVGSDNVCLRSWTHDSELSCTILDETHDERAPRDPAGLGDGARRFARELRLRLWREHLGVDSDDGLIDPVEAFQTWRTAAEELDAWHAGGKSRPRPCGRVRVHDPGRQSAVAKRVARPLLRLVVDPDGRPRGLRRARQF
jgi:phosphatidylserine/phosphatidylglycerophosphate/cardiolipin synthase-like enzyme